MAVELGVNAGFVTEAPTADPNGSNVQITRRAYALKVTSPVGALRVIEIGWWADGATGEADFDVGIYDHNVGDDEAEAKVGNFAINNAKGTTAGWKRVTGLNISIDAETIYWIAVQVDYEGEWQLMNYGSGGGRTASKTSLQTALVDPWGTSSTLVDNQLLALYAVYEAAAGVTRKIKIAGTFQDKPIKEKKAGTFQDKPISIKVGGTFQDA